ncbi:MAG: hypothetical protein R3A79_25500 [Nannocystaceae bacterium]
MGLKEAVNKFTDSVKDLSTLRVTTYTGSLEQAITEAGEINWDAFKPTNGKLVLAAATQIDADYDTTNFQSSDAAIANLDELLELHKAAIESALGGRTALVKMFTGLLK